MVSTPLGYVSVRIADLCMDILRSQKRWLIPVSNGLSLPFALLARLPCVHL